jgi:ankyrin repeat protein
MARLSCAVIALLCCAVARADNLESAKAAIRVKDYETAVKLLSDQRTPSAQYLLASLYLAGLAIPGNGEPPHFRARNLLESAAKQGEPRAAFALAGLLANQEPRDASGAQQWLNRAAELRFAPAVELKKRNELPLTFRPQSDLPDDAAKRDAFWYAAATDDVITLQALANAKWISETDEFGRTALHRAAENGAGNAVAWLVKQHAAIDAVDRYEVTPLMLAAASKSSNALKVLVDAKAKVAAVDNAGNSALTYAARNNRVEQVSALLDAGAPLAARNKNGWSAVDYALQADAKQAAELLRTRGAVAVRQATAAAVTRSSEILHAPAKFPDLYAGWSDVAVAVTRDDPVLIQETLRRSANSDRSLLLIAAETQSPKSTSALLSKGADATHSNSRGTTPLVFAIERGDAPTMRALLKAGVRADTHSKQEPPPVIAAIRADREVLVQELLTAGADANATFENATALMCAAQRGQAQSIDALLAAHAAIDAADGNGRSALWFAAHAGHDKAVAVLLRAHASDAADKFGVTALLEASARGSLLVVEQLLGANVHVKSKSGDTPLIVAAANGHAEVVQRLLKAKSEIDSQNSRGDTALIAASRAGHDEIVAALLQAGASSKLRNNEKVAAEDAARARGFEQLATLIEKR